MTNIQWSTQQKEIFNFFILGRGNAVVTARAGAAKTTTIIEGLNRANASSMLYAVFNKKNQLEAEKKITNKDKVNVKTLHSIGFSFILKNWRGVRASGYAEFARIKDLYPDAPEQVVFQAARLVSYLKNTLEKPNKTEALQVAALRDIDLSKKNSDMGWTLDKLADMALDSIEKSLSYPKNKLISFDDMVWLPNVQNWVKPSYALVAIDEAQDMNVLQLKMAIGCCNAGGKIILIGDPAQCIYNFRGAMQDGMEKYQLELNAKQFSLPISYRCPRKVIEMAQKLVPDIQAKPDAIEGSIETISYDTMLKDIKVKQTILSRTNFPLMKACLSLLRNNKPAYIEGREIGEKLEKLIDSFEPKDLNDFFTKLDSWLAVHQAKAGYNAGRRIEEATDTHATLRVLSDTCLTVADLKNKLNKLFLDANNVRVPSVICQTVHKSKGNEFSEVYLLEETFSAGRRVLTPAETIEEKNIRYVAITRTMEKLFLVV